MKKREEASLSTFRIKKKNKANKSFYNLIILLFTKEIIELKRNYKRFLVHLNRR